MGLGGGTVSIDGRPIASPAGGAAWVTDDLLIYQICRGGVCVLETFDARNGLVTEVADAGANEIAAGGGVWAAWRAGFGLFTSFGLHLPDAGPATVGPDGVIAYKPQHQSFGPVVMRAPDGSTRTLIDTAPRDLQLLGGDRAIWAFHDSRIGVSGIPLPVTLDSTGGLWRPRAVSVEGEWWALYFHNSARLVLHPFTSTRGYVLHQGVNAFGHDLVAEGSVITVGFAWNEGEQPGDERRVVINIRSAARVELAGGPVIVIPDPDPKPEVPVYERISPDYAHLVAAAALKYPDAWEATRERPDGSKDGTFVQLLAADLHAIDPKVGLNGKRGGDEPSTDALAYLNPSGPGGVEVIDVISGGHQPQWVDVTIPPPPHPQSRPDQPNGIPGKFIAPSGASPAPVTHAYVGGDHDSGECDFVYPSGAVCRLPRGAAVHQVSEPGPGPGQVPAAQHPALAPIVLQLTSLASRLAAVPACPPVPPEKVCPPCELPHGGGGAALTATYDEALGALEEADAVYRAAQKARGVKSPENLSGATAAHLTWRLVVEGYTREQVVEEARERGRG